MIMIKNNSLCWKSVLNHQKISNKLHKSIINIDRESFKVYLANALSAVVLVMSRT